MSETLPSPPVRKSPGKRLLSWSVYLLAALILCELFFRLFWTEPPMTYIIEGNHPIYHHVPKAFTQAGLGEYDFRGRRYRVEKAPDTLRIVFLGDSFTYSMTSPNQTIPRHLEKLLAEKHPALKVEILNFGMVSYSPIIQELEYHNLVRELKADWVLWLYDTFDPIDDTLYSRLATVDPETGRVVAVPGEPYRKTGFRRSAFLRFIEFAWSVANNDWDFLPERMKFMNYPKFARNPSDFQDMIDRSFTIAGRLGKTIQGDGSKLLLFQYPWPFHLRDLHEFAELMIGWGVQFSTWETPTTNRFGELVLDFCRKKGFSCYDFFPEVRRMEDELGADGSRLTIYYNNNGHFTAKANARFARFILDRLEENGFARTP